MSEDTRLRFWLADRLMRMRYGDTHLIDRDKAAMAWPPTGDADHSIEGALKAMAVASYGGAPISSYTTAERIIRDLDDSFAEPEQRPEDGAWLIHRKLSACPKCGGRGFVPKWPEPSLSFAVDNDAMSLTETVTIERVKCDHAALCIKRTKRWSKGSQ